MARFQKTALRSGLFPQGGNYIHVSDADKQTAVDSYQKMLSYGYKAPVILEHADKNDPNGFPAKKGQMSAREKLQFQAGWGDDLVFGANGDLDVVANVKSRDGLKLIREVGTYLSPQFGPWKVPDTGEILPMAITHFAMTAAPVDIGQNPEWKELPENSQVIEATQLSQQVTFSMAGFIPEKPKSGGDKGDSDKNNNGVVDGQKPGKPGSAIGDSGDTDTDNDGDNDSTPDGQLGDQMPDPGQANTFAQIGAALKMLGVILPETVSHADNPEALLAALMTAAHHKNEAATKEAMTQQPDPMQQVQGQMPGQTPGQDPRLQGAKQENMFTMSQTNPEGKKKTDTTVTTQTPAAPAVPDLKAHPDFIQMSQSNQALSAELTEMKREKFNTRIERLVATGRATKEKADKFKIIVGTYQFSANATSADIVKLEAKLEELEELPEGAIWSPDQRVQQMSMIEHGQTAFFQPAGVVPLSAKDEDAELEKRFG